MSKQEETPTHPTSCDRLGGGYETLRSGFRIVHTVAAPLIAAASNQEIFSGQLTAASIQERLLIKK